MSAVNTKGAVIIGDSTVLDFKTTWSEFQKASQTATERGKAKLRTFNFKTT